MFLQKLIMELHRDAAMQRDVRQSTISMANRLSLCLKIFALFSSFRKRSEAAAQQQEQPTNSAMFSSRFNVLNRSI